MPKETLRIDDFTGGINEKADARDIEDNQATVFANFSNSQRGKLKLQGNWALRFTEINKWGNYRGCGGTTTGNSQGSTIGQYLGYGGTLVATTKPGTQTSHEINNYSNGYGLFSFVHDFNYGGSDGETDVAEIPTEFICIGNGHKVDVFDPNPNVGDNLDRWEAGLIDLTNTIDGETGRNDNVRHTFEWNNSVLRVYDANPDNWPHHSAKFLAHINKNFFSRVDIDGEGALFSLSDSTISNTKEANKVNKWISGYVNYHSPQDALDGNTESGYKFTPLTVIRAGINYDSAGSVTFNTSGDSWGANPSQHNPDGGMQVLLEFD